MSRRATYMVRVVMAACALAIICAVAVPVSPAPIVQVDDTSQLLELDLSSEIAEVNQSCFSWWPELYTPDDFAGGLPAQPQEVVRDPQVYGTYYISVQLQPGRTYGLSAYSATYAQNVWVNGQLLSQVGTVANNAEDAVPAATYYTVYFQAGTGPTEIVIQRSDFFHAAGGQLYPQFLAEQDLITAMNNASLLRGGITVGCMVAVALLFVCMFSFFPRRVHFLWFALACLCVAIRTLSIDHKLIYVLFPALDWGIFHRVEYLATLGFWLFFLMYVNSLLGSKVPRPLAVGGLCAVGGIVAATVLLPSLWYTRLPLLNVLAVAVGVALFVLATRSLLTSSRRRRPELWFVLLGMVALLAGVAGDVWRYMRLDDLNLTQVGMLGFVFANTVALALNFTRTEAELARAREREQSMAEANRALEQINTMRTDHLATVSHELYTPLAVISGLAQLTQMQLEVETSKGSAAVGADAQDGAPAAESADAPVYEEATRNLETIAREAMRLASLADGLLVSATGNESGRGRCAVDARILIDQAASIARPICEGKECTLHVSVPPDAPAVYVNAEAITQVLVNLVSNASRHARGGTVGIEVVSADGGPVAVSVVDDGEGMEPEVAARAFERRKSGDGRTGLGLFVCKQVVETHGGHIFLRSTPGEGTTVTFTLPVADGDVSTTDRAAQGVHATSAAVSTVTCASATDASVPDADHTATLPSSEGGPCA